MIDFGCKEFRLDEIIKCGLGLTKADCKIFMYLIEHSDDIFTTEELSKKLNLNLTTVQRGVKKLTEKEVLFRSQENLDGGGYVFTYRMKKKEKVRELIYDIVKRWVAKVKLELDRL